MKWKILITLIILFAIYVYSYYRSPKHTHVIQSHIRMFKPELLLEKQPVIIDDNDFNIESLKSLYFNINPSNHFVLQHNDIWCRNKYKYLLLQSTYGPCDILLCNPNDADSSKNIPYESDSDTESSDIVEIQLSEGQIVIIPFNWLYLIIDSKVDCLGIHDYITYLLP